MEEAKYMLLKTLGNGVEVRKYPAQVVAKTSMAPGMNGSFGRIAGYIFGKNKRETAIAMTAPVFLRAISKRHPSRNQALGRPISVRLEVQGLPKRPVPPFLLELQAHCRKLRAQPAILIIKLEQALSYPQIVFALLARELSFRRIFLKCHA